MPSSTPSSPQSRRSRRPSRLQGSSASGSPYVSNGFSPTHSPQTSRSSIPNSPVTPRQVLQYKMSRSESLSSDTPAVMMDHGGGMGSLADELDGSWAEGETDDQLPRALEGRSPVTGEFGDMQVLGIRTTMGATQSPIDGRRLSPVTTRSDQAQQKHHHRSKSEYDGSDYGNDSDLEEVEGLSRNLVARMADIEALARRGTADPQIEGASTVESTIARLKDLGPQSTLENGAARLSTAHSSITSHLSHQTRSVQTLTHPLLNTAYPSFPQDMLNDLIGQVELLIPNLPFPPLPSPVPSFQTLITSTIELLECLNSLSDSLEESRFLTSTASRRLKGVRDLVAEFRQDDDARETGIRWIENGRWNQRLQEKEAKRICSEVVDGFKSTCDMWQTKLLNSAVTSEVGA